MILGQNAQVALQCGRGGALRACGVTCGVGIPQAMSRFLEDSARQKLNLRGSLGGSAGPHRVADRRAILSQPVRELLLLRRSPSTFAFGYRNQGRRHTVISGGARGCWWASGGRMCRHEHNHSHNGPERG